MKCITNTLAIVSLLISISACADIEKIGSVKFEGRVYQPKDISAIASTGSFLIIGADEGSIIQVLDRGENNRSYLARNKGFDLLKNQTVDIPEDVSGEPESEIDIEAIAREGNTLFIAGSHSWKRKKVDPEKAYDKNRKRIKKLKLEKTRDKIFMLTINKNTGVPGSDLKSTSLREIINNDEILGLFSKIPSKENGVDIEGIAVDGDTLYIGLRGPVLRLNYVPIMKIPFDRKDDKDYELYFVNLGGRGCRDIIKVDNGFLILGGPVGDFGSYELYYWNGKDCIPGEGGQGGEVIPLGKIPTPDGMKAEGVTVLEETKTYYKIIIVYDSARLGNPTLFNVSKP